MVFEMGGRWPYNSCFVRCCLQDLFSTARSILVPSSFFSIRFVSVHVVHPYSSIDTTTAWKKLRFISLGRSDFHMTDSLSIAVPAFASHVLMSFSVDERLLPSEVNLSIGVLIIGGDISTLNGGSLKLVDKFTYLGSSISSRKCINPIIPPCYVFINTYTVLLQGWFWR